MKNKICESEKQNGHPASSSVDKSGSFYLWSVQWLNVQFKKKKKNHIQHKSPLYNCACDFIKKARGTAWG